MSGKSGRAVVAVALCIGIPILVLVLHLPTSPRFVPLSPDSGVFAYAGKLVTQGELPYRDFFDHKPPLIFYIDALAIFIAGPSPWSIWWLDVLYLGITGIVFFLVLSRVTSVWTGGLGSGLFILTLMTPWLFTGGNYTETYGLLPQILVIAAACAYFAGRKTGWIFAAGMLTSLASLFKQTNIALGISTILVCLYFDILAREARTGIKHALLFALGFLLPWGITAGIWAGFHAFPQFWDAVVLYNLFYVQGGSLAVGFSEAVQTILGSASLLPFLAIALAGLCIFLWGNRDWLFRRARPDIPAGPRAEDRPAAEKLFLVVFAAIPFEILFIALSGRNYAHYYLTLLPALVFACGYTFDKLIRTIRIASAWQAASLGFTALLLVVWAVPTFSSVRPQRQHLASLRMLGDRSIAQDDLVAYINDHTRPRDPVLVWQVRTGVNFITGRPTPSRYLYPLPLFVRTEGSTSRFEQFMQDLEVHPPVLIILLQNDQTVPAFDVPDDKLCPGCIPEALAGMKKLKAYVLANYQVAAQLDQYRIYSEKGH